MPQENGISKGESIYKAGKLIRVKAKFMGEVIEDIRITGDFFLYPEESIESIEKSLRGTTVEDAKRKLSEIMNDMEYEGIDPESLSKAIKDAWMRRR